MALQCLLDLGFRNGRWRQKKWNRVIQDANGCTRVVALQCLLNPNPIAVGCTDQDVSADNASQSSLSQEWRFTACFSE